MEAARRLLLRTVNAARFRLGDTQVPQEQQLAAIHSEVGEIRRQLSQLEQSQSEKLERIESGVGQNALLLSRVVKQVDRALQPRWRSLVILTAAAVCTTIIIMLLLF